MAGNALTARLAETQRRGTVTEDSLHDYAEQLNRQYWVIASGKPYSVKRRELDGKIVAFLDRLG